MSEKIGSGADPVDPHDADMGRLYAAYVNEAREEFFKDAKAVAPQDWTSAAVGLVALVVLGGIILSQVL